MTLNIYSDQKTIKKTYEIDSYDIMYGTIQDILDVLDNGLESLNNDTELLKLIVANRGKIEDLILDIFASEGLTKEELRYIKLKELIPMFVELFGYVQDSFKSKN
ncbi:hypothetical protein [uncultured Methanobrevibacter sp.]|uniref:hypothetical protein n=1 Tax=uncultured Methanobrevibacter sp. TaxID=253161 RepID=UPI00261A84E9|nr:hypothetical protein [uncultured Methanobrevibacter sp.]